MSEDQQKLQMLHNKLVTIQMEVKRAMDLLMEIRTHEPVPSQLPPPGRLTQAQAVEYVTKRLPEAWVPDLEVSAGIDGSVTVKAKRWMDTGWGDVDRAVSAMGGAWVREGKNSHWRIPSKGGSLT